MKEPEFEKYCFLRLHSIDMNTASNAIKTLKRYKRADVQAALLRDIAVIYSRPFSGNKGSKIRKHFLSESHVPKKLKPLHKKLLELRNGQIAHTDLTFHKPKVSRWPTKTGSIYPMSFKGFNYQSLLNELPEIAELINAVEQSINSEVKLYESRF